MIFNSLGWIGALAFAFCALPQAIQCWKQGHAYGVNPTFLTLWIIGEITTLAYVIGDMGFKWPLIVNYVMNLTFIGVIGYFYLFPSNSSHDPLPIPNPSHSTPKTHHPPA